MPVAVLPLGLSTERFFRVTEVFASIIYIDLSGDFSSCGFWLLLDRTFTGRCWERGGEGGKFKGVVVCTEKYKALKYSVTYFCEGQ